MSITTYEQGVLEARPAGEREKKKKGHQTGAQHPAVSARITDQYKRLIMKEATGTASLLLQSPHLRQERKKQKTKYKIQT